MENEKSNGKLYRVYIKPNCHLSKKQNENGRVSALQFDNENNLNGPVEIEEVTPLYDCEPNDVNPYFAYVMENYIKPALEYGVDRLISLFCEKSVPKIKKSMYKLSDSIKNHLSIIRDVISKKELTIDRLEREKAELEKSKKMHHNKTEYSEYSAEEIQDLIDGLRTVVLDIVRYISILSNAPANEECNYEENSRILALLCSKVVMNQIELCLQEKNRPLLDDNTYQILSEFYHGNLIGENKAYQIISCLPSDKGNTHC